MASVELTKCVSHWDLGRSGAGPGGKKANRRPLPRHGTAADVLARAPETNEGEVDGAPVEKKETDAATLAAEKEKLHQDIESKMQTEITGQ